MKDTKQYQGKMADMGRTKRQGNYYRVYADITDAQENIIKRVCEELQITRTDFIRRAISLYLGQMLRAIDDREESQHNA